MRLKSLLAALVAIAMITVPCAAVVGVQDAYAEKDDETELKVGDALGFGTSFDSLDGLISLIMGYPYDPEETGDNEDDDTLSEILDMFGSFDFEVIIAGIAEVVKADKTGYEIEFDAGISVDAGVCVDVESLEYLYEQISEMTPKEGVNPDDFQSGIDYILDILSMIFGDGELFIELNGKVAATLHGNIKFNSDLEATRANMSFGAMGKISLETNIDLISTMEGLEDIFGGVPVNTDSEGDGDDEDKDPAVKYLADGKRDVYSLTLGLFTDVGTYGNNIFVTEEYGSEARSFILLDNATYVSGMYLYIDAPEDFFDFIKNEEEFIGDLFENNDSKEAGYTDFGMGDYGYTKLFIIYDGRAIVYAPIGMDDFIDIKLPILSDAGEVEEKSWSVLLIDESSKNDIRDKLNRIDDVSDSMTSKLKPKVSVYTIDEGSERELYDTSTVSFNGIADLPVLENITRTFEGEETEYQFMGWCNDDGFKWNPSWKIKTDLELYPMYSEIYTDFSHIDPNGSTYVKIDINDLEDVSLNFDFTGVLQVAVYDGDDLLYVWNVPGTDGSGEITNFKVESLTGGKLFNKAKKELGGDILYLDFKSSGETPPGTTFSYYVGEEYANGTVLNVYFVIEDDEGNFLGLDSVGTATVIDGMATFDINHCSGYVVSLFSFLSDDDPSGLKTYIIYVAVALFILAGAAFIMNRRSSRTNL